MKQLSPKKCLSFFCNLSHQFLLAIESWLGNTPFQPFGKVKFVVLLFLASKILRCLTLHRSPGSSVRSLASHFVQPLPQFLLRLSGFIGFVLGGKREGHKWKRILLSITQDEPKTRNRYLTSPLGKIMPSDPLNLFLIAQNSFIATSFTNISYDFYLYKLNYDVKRR